MKNKKAQLELSFGMIFSIILIITFLAFASWGIYKIVNIQKEAQVAKFYNDLQSDVNDIWKTGRGSQEKIYNLPSSIEKVCFLNTALSGSGKESEIYEELIWASKGEVNVIFYPVRAKVSKVAFQIENLNILKTTEKSNPLCFENNGKVKFILKMNSGENQVFIE